MELIRGLSKATPVNVPKLEEVRRIVLTTKYQGARSQIDGIFFVVYLKLLAVIDECQLTVHVI